MRTPEFRKLPAGSLVIWREKSGAVTGHGVVCIEGERHFIRWHDGDESEPGDAWAIKGVEKAPSEVSTT